MVHVPYSTSGNLYCYGGNNPVRYKDPTGEWIDTVLDIAGIAWDVVDIAACPANPTSWVALAADVGCVFIPGATGAGRVIKAAEGTKKIAKASKAIKAAGITDNFVDAVKSGERIFGKHGYTKKITKGLNHALESHHLIPKSLADILKIHVDDFAAVVIDQETHNGFSKFWNPKIDELKKLNRDELIEQLKVLIKKAYKDNPEMLVVAQKWLESI